MARTATDKAGDRAAEARVIANIVKRAELLSPAGFVYLLDLLRDVEADRRPSGGAGAGAAAPKAK